MMLPVFGHPSAELDGLKKQPNKSSHLKFTIKSFLSHLTPIHRTILFVVILFQLVLVLYVTRTPNLSLSESPRPSPEFQAVESRTVSNVPSKTSRSLPNKGASSFSSETYASLLNKRVPNVSSRTSRCSLPKKGVTSISSETYNSLPKKGASNVFSRTSRNLPNQGGSSISSETYGSLPNKGISNVLSRTSHSLPNEGASNISSETYGRLPYKVISNISSETYGSLQNKSCDSGLIYVYDLPPVFNYELMNNCSELDPWHNKCKTSLNDGFGVAAKELAGIVPDSVLPAWYWTDLFWGEVVFHNRMLDYKCRTLEPESATAFYIPFYAGLAVTKYLWNHTGRERDWHGEMLIKWVQEQKWWKRSNGSDHIIMLGRMTWDFRRSREADSDWGSSFIHMPEMKNVIRLSVERDQWDELEIAVPYPTSFHPRSESDITEWQSFVRSRRRNYLLTFVGGARATIKNDFRGILQNQCVNEPTACHHVDCARKNCVDGTTSIMEAFLDSDFCLQPRGDAFTRRSVFDCMVAGSIPVFFWKRTAYLQYEFFLPAEPESYSVFIHRNDVRNGTDIKRVLEGYSRDEVERMREKVIECIPRFVYAKPRQGLEKTRDAFDIAIGGVLRKYKNHMQRGKLELD